MNTGSTNNLPIICMVPLKGLIKHGRIQETKKTIFMQSCQYRRTYVVTWVNKFPEMTNEYDYSKNVRCNVAG